MSKPSFDVEQLNNITALPGRLAADQPETNWSTMSTRRLISTFILLLTLSVCVKSQSTTDTLRDNMLKLKKDLFLNNRIDIHVPPTGNHNDSVIVTLSISLRNILELNDMDGTIRANIWTNFNWGDSRLQWDPEKYGGVKVLKITSDHVWKPDVTIYNSATAKEMYPFGNAEILLYPEGHMLWIPPATIHSTCKLDHKYYPFDEQTCFMKFGSWVYDGLTVALRLESNSSAFSIEDYTENPVWEIKSTNAILKLNQFCCETHYPEITFNITLRRRSPYFKSLLVTPAILAIILTLTVFCIPSSSNSRISIATFTCITLLILLLYLGWRVPMGGDRPPLIFIFCNSLFVMSALSIPISVIVSHIEGRSKHIPVPRALAFLTKGTFGRILFMGSVSYQVHVDRGVKLLDGEPGQENQEVDHQASESEWKMAAAAIDRLIFALYCFIFSIILLAYLA